MCRMGKATACPSFRVFGIAHDKAIRQQAVAQSTQIPWVQFVARRMGKAIACPSFGDWTGFDGHALLCPSYDLVAEYALSDIQKPIGVSEYQLTQSLPKNLQSKLPGIEEIENELGGEL